MPVFIDIPKDKLPTEDRTLASRVKQSVLSYVSNGRGSPTTLPLYQKPMDLGAHCHVELVDHH